MSESIEWLMTRMGQRSTDSALIWYGNSYRYRDLLAKMDELSAAAVAAGITRGSVVAVIGDFSLASVAWVLTLIRCGAIVVPLARAAARRISHCLQIAEVEFSITVDGRDDHRIDATGARADHPLVRQVRRSGDGALVLFSSGTSAEPKAALHRLAPMLEKFESPRRCYRTLAFLLFDHIGGFNTLMHTLANGGCLVVPPGLTASAVADTIESSRAQLLPTTPSFLNLLVASGIHADRDLSSLEVITYGTEPIAELVLRRIRAAFPEVRLKQTYGLTEVGIMRSKSASDDSLLVRIGGEGYQTRVVNGTLHVRARNAMLGYLNASSPFDADGWLDTGDCVEQTGDYLRILGRRAETINVGGQKVHPSEIERAILDLPDVVDVAVRGEPHPLLGQTVVAKVQLARPMTNLQLKRVVTRWCRGQLQPYMIPSRVEATTSNLLGPRQKKARR